jgi:hypothetical protein
MAGGVVATAMAGGAGWEALAPLLGGSGTAAKDGSGTAAKDMKETP